MESDARIAIVWLPMVPGDDRAAAAEAAAAFPAERTAHFWDESRLIGRTWSADFVPRHREELRAAVSDEPELLERVENWSSDPELAPSAWDCAFFYVPGSAWTEPMPAPRAWTKQFGFWIANEDESGGTFWCDRSTTALVDSSWNSEMETGMRRITASATGSATKSALQIELLGFEGCPNTRILRTNAEEALKSLGISAQLQYVDEETLAADDTRRGWPAPTMLVGGRDLFGLPAPANATLSCRMYPGGVPGVAEIAAALRSVASRDGD